jgi:hypothetical protein
MMTSIKIGSVRTIRPLVAGRHRARYRQEKDAEVFLFFFSPSCVPVVQELRNRPQEERRELSRSLKVVVNRKIMPYGESWQDEGPDAGNAALRALICGVAGAEKVDFGVERFPQWRPKAKALGYSHTHLLLLRRD